MVAAAEKPAWFLRDQGHLRVGLFNFFYIMKNNTISSSFYDEKTFRSSVKGVRSLIISLLSESDCMVLAHEVGDALTFLETLYEAEFVDQKSKEL